MSAERLLVWLYASDSPWVLDVRGHGAYRAGSLPGALDAGADPRGYLPDHGADPVVLLAGENADSSTLAAWTKRLADAGHPVWVLAGGLAAWRAAGGNVEIPDTHYSQPGRTPFLIPKGLCEGNAPAQVFE